MSKTYTTLKSAIITKLKAINGGDGQPLFVDVFSSLDKTATGYPIAFLVELAGDGSIIDTARNEREWRFQLTIHHEMGRKNPDDVSDAIIDAVDKVVTSFDEDPQFKDVNSQPQAKLIRVLPIDFDYGSAEQSFAIAVLDIAVVDLVSRF